MNRAQFIKITGLSLLATGVKSCKTSPVTINPDVISISDLSETGHLIRDPNNFKSDNTESLFVENVVVGAGISGLTAASCLNSNTLLFEIDSFIGGTSKEYVYKNIRTPAGAHYDLPYPSYFGQKALSFLEKNKIIEFSNATKQFEFVERKFYVNSDSNNINLRVGNSQKNNFFTNNPEARKFVKAISKYVGKMKMPTRSMSADLNYLNEITFKDYLHSINLKSSEVLDVINYNMIDDYGAGIDSVSAFAGIHYYTCRDYLNNDIPYFSPPEGNAYFANKIARNIDSENILLNSMVYEIKSIKDQFEVKVLNVKSKECSTYMCNNIVYAAPKHTLPYICKGHYKVTSSQSSWIVANVIYSDPLNLCDFNSWHYDHVSKSSRVGFVSNSQQFQDSKDYKSITVYYCLSKEDKKSIKELRANKLDFIYELMDYLKTEYNTDLIPLIKKVNITLHGHGMPIPEKDYLFRDMNEDRPYKNMVYAGVDNHRLPLFFEAVDSGIVSSELLLDNVMK
jgi:protoporphyrinogen oxidase